MYKTKASEIFYLCISHNASLLFSCLAEFVQYIDCALVSLRCCFRNPFPLCYRVKINSLTSADAPKCTACL